jgi:hypothetical protein
MKTLLKIAALILLGIIAIKLAFGLLAFTLGLIIPLAILFFVGFIVWKIIGGKEIWQKLTGSQQKTFVHTQSNWQMDEDLIDYKFPSQEIERKKPNSLKY